MPERAFIFGSFAALRFQANVPVKLVHTRDQLSFMNAQLLAFSYEKMPTFPEKPGFPGQITNFPDQITHFQGECKTSERSTKIMKWERLLETAQLANEPKEPRVRTLRNA